MMDKAYLDQIYQSIHEKYRFSYPLVKKKLARAGFFQFFFTERKKIGQWNQPKSLLLVSFFSIRIRGSLNKAFSDLFFTYIFPFSRHLDKILNESWRWKEIDKREYNLLVFFKDFCDKYEVFCKSPDHSGSEGIDEHLYYKMEAAFFRLIYHPEYQKTLLAGIVKILNAHKKLFYDNNEKMNEVINNLELFFAAKYQNNNFYDLIIAFNIVKYRTYFELEDLLIKSKQELISGDFYQCNKKIFEQIIAYVYNIMNDLDKFEQNLKELLWMKSVKFKVNHSLPVELIKYCRINEKEWTYFENDIYPFLLSVLRIVITDLKELLNKKWDIMTIKEKIIKVRLITKSSVHHLLSDLVEEYQQANTRFNTAMLPKINRDEFIQFLLFNTHQLDPNQQFVYEKVNAALNCITRIAILLKEELETKADVDQLQYMVDKPVKWRGKQVKTAIQYYIDIFMQICSYFNERYFIEQINKVTFLEKQIKYYNERLMRIVDSNQIIKNMISEKKNGI